jgi:hypothetical protein
MQYSLYAFIPLGVLLGTALIAVSFSLWPGLRRRKAATISNKPRRSAEIISFPGRREQVLPMPAARGFRAGASVRDG